jgi:hypothetical protein
MPKTTTTKLLSTTTKQLNRIGKPEMPMKTVNMRMLPSIRK